MRDSCPVFGRWTSEMLQKKNTPLKYVLIFMYKLSRLWIFRGWKGSCWLDLNGAIYQRLYVERECTHLLQLSFCHLSSVLYDPCRSHHFFFVILPLVVPLGIVHSYVPSVGLWGLPFDLEVDDSFTKPRDAGLSPQSRALCRYVR